MQIKKAFNNPSVMFGARTVRIRDEKKAHDVVREPA